MSKQTIVKHAVEVNGKMYPVNTRQEARLHKRFMKSRGKDVKIIRQQYVLVKTEVVR